MDYETAVNHGYPIIDTADGPTFLLPKDMFLDDLLEAVANGVFGAWEELTTRPEYRAVQASVEDVAKAETYTPTSGMKSAAKRALRWKEEGKATGAGTPVGWGRATDIVAGRGMSLSTVKRMYSFFSRHEVDKQGKDFDNTANPSNGRIMWDAWGGDSGFSWSRGIVERTKDDVAKYAEGQPRNAHGQFSFAGTPEGRPYELQPKLDIYEDYYDRRNATEYGEYNNDTRDYDKIYQNGDYGPRSQILCAIDDRGLTNVGGISEFKVETELAWHAKGKPLRTPYEDANYEERDNAALKAIAEDPDYPKVPSEYREWAKNAYAERYGTENLLEKHEINRQALAIWRRNDEAGYDEWAENENKFVQSKLREVKLEGGQSVGEVMDGYKADIVSNMGRLAKTMDVSVSLGKSKVALFVNEDHYKTVYEVGKVYGKGSGGEEYFRRRTATEDGVGVPEGTKGSNRPVYGVLGDLTSHVYGDSSLILKPSVKDRITLTIGDSIDDGSQGAIWSSDYANNTVSDADFWRVNARPFNNLITRSYSGVSSGMFEGRVRTNKPEKFESIRSYGQTYDMATQNKYDEYPVLTRFKGVNFKEFVGSNYIEAQIHGGLSMKDIAHVIIPSSDALTRAQKTLLNDNGASVEVSTEVKELWDKWKS